MRDHEVSVAQRPAGELVGIAAFTNLKGSKRARPRLVCVGCEGEVIPRVGSVRRAHFAHLGRSDCWVLSKEGKAHLEAKLHLAEQLRAVPADQRASLGLAVTCGREPGDSSPDLFGCKAESHQAFGPWETVQVEKRANLTTRRPDVQLLDEEGEVVVSFEIVHTHAVDARKAAEMFGSGVPWVELDVSDDGLQRVLAWRAGDPVLPVSRTSVDFAWRCDEHAAVEAPIFVKLIDYYFPTPEPWRVLEYTRRDVAWVVRRWVHGEMDTDTLYVQTAYGQPEHLGSWAARKERTSGRRLGKYLRESLTPMPETTRQDVSEWIMLEHIPAEQRGSAIELLRTNYERVPYRLRWSDEKKREVAVARRFDWFDQKVMKGMVLVFLARLQGHDRPWPETPRHPYAVPVIPKRLRAAWLMDQIADLWVGHIDGDRPIAGLPPMTREDFFAWMKGEKKIEFNAEEMYEDLMRRGRETENAENQPASTNEDGA